MFFFLGSQYEAPSDPPPNHHVYCKYSHWDCHLLPIVGMVLLLWAWINKLNYFFACSLLIRKESMLNWRMLTTRCNWYVLLSKTQKNHYWQKAFGVYFNNRVFHVSRTYQLIVALRKFDVLKPLLANMLVPRTPNFQEATIRLIDPKQKHSDVIFV